jgi:site-specific DNA-methyltransferase (adenine-specific)
MKAIAKALREENPKKNTQKRVAALLGVGRETVRDWFTDKRGHNGGSAKVTPPTPRPDARVVLSRDQKAEAVKRCKDGETQKQVAADLGVSEATVKRQVATDRKQREGNRKRRAAAKKAQDLGDLGVIHGVYQDHEKALASGCVDLIFTDPPYDRKTLPQYRDLGEFAGRVLKPGGSLICYLGDYLLPEVLDAVLKAEGLKFWWPLVCLHTGATTNMKQWGVIVQHKLMLWFVKGNTRSDKGFVNSLVTSERDKKHHDWGQGLPEAQYYIDKLVPRGGLVVDPYCGGGTTCVAAIASGRRYLAFEKDHETALIARKRIAGTDRP